MADGDKTTTRRLPVWFALALGVGLAAVPGLVAARAGLQELAVSTRPDGLTPKLDAEASAVDAGAGAADAGAGAADAGAGTADAGAGAATRPRFSMVLFARGSARLTPSATRILDRVGRALALQGRTADRLRIEAATDGAAGGQDASQDLAARRAQAIAAYLEQNCGISAVRLEVATRGASRLGGRRASLTDVGPGR